MMSLTTKQQIAYLTDARHNALAMVLAMRKLLESILAYLQGELCSCIDEEDNHEQCGRCSFMGLIDRTLSVLARPGDITFPKLVRDRCPELFPENTYDTIPKEYMHRFLIMKMFEELYEYVASNKIAELGDLTDVIYSIVSLKRVSIDDFDKARRQKCKQKGGFEKGIALVEVRDGS